MDSVDRMMSSKAMWRFCERQPEFRKCRVGCMVIAEDPWLAGGEVYVLGDFAIASSLVVTALRFDAWMRRESQ